MPRNNGVILLKLRLRNVLGFHLFEEQDQLCQSFTTELVKM